MTRTAPMSAYKTLGVTPEDDFATIRRAWIRLVKTHHPDVTGGDIEEGTRKLAELNNAYDALRWHNPKKLRIIKEREEKGWRARRRKAQAKEPPSDSAQTDQTAQAPREANPTAATCPPQAQPPQAQPQNERRETLWASFDSAQAKERFRAGQRLCAAASQVDLGKILHRA